MTQFYDVFNGDADGLCSLHQYRMQFPETSHLISGPKRSIELLARVPLENDLNISVFDISLDKNYDSVIQQLRLSNTVVYFDHHQASRTIEHPKFRMVWSDDAEVCTSLLVFADGGKHYPDWAIAGAFGDNQFNAATSLSNSYHYSLQQISQLKELGFLLNFNSYGETIDDLVFDPVTLYREMYQYKSAFAFVSDSFVIREINEAWKEADSRAQDLSPILRTDKIIAYRLPNEVWAHRISGFYANQLSRQISQVGIAVITDKENNLATISIRSNNPEMLPAHEFCRQFTKGGGRRKAAGINDFQLENIDDFCIKFQNYFSV